MAAPRPSTTWYGASSNNYTNANRPTSDPINKVVIHVMQGSFSSAINWFKNSSAGVSCHYNVRSSDGFIGQSVAEEDIAWHAGNWEYNRTSVGIEHEGYVSNPDWFTDAMYRSSAKLTAYLCGKYRIPIDRNHIVGHSEVPGATHTDPGRYWNWTKYMSLVKSYAGTTAATAEGPPPGPTTAYKQVVDNSTSGRFSADAAWGSSTWNQQCRGANYRYVERPTVYQRPAQYKVKIPAAARYTVYGWWPADPAYNPRTSFYIKTASGWAKRVVDQRSNGGRWVNLGTYQMPVGDGWSIQVSSKSPNSGKIMADAVAVVRA